MPGDGSRAIGLARQSSERDQFPSSWWQTRRPRGPQEAAATQASARSMVTSKQTRLQAVVGPLDWLLSRESRVPGAFALRLLALSARFASFVSGHHSGGLRNPAGGANSKEPAEGSRSNTLQLASATSTSLKQSNKYFTNNTDVGSSLPVYPLASSCRLSAPHSQLGIDSSAGPEAQESNKSPTFEGQFQLMDDQMARSVSLCSPARARVLV